MLPTSSRHGRTLSRSGCAASRGRARRRAAQVVVRETRNGKFQQTVSVGPHRLLADEPISAGGADTGPGPYDFVLAGLGACTSMTMRLYADRKSLPLERVTVTLQHSRVYAQDCAACEAETGMLDQIDRSIAMEGALDAGQRAKLMEIADKCPVHRTLTAEILYRDPRRRLNGRAVGRIVAGQRSRHAGCFPPRSQERFFRRRMEPADLAQLFVRHASGRACVGDRHRGGRAGDAVAQSADLGDRGDGRRYTAARAGNPDARGRARRAACRQGDQ